MRRIAAATVVGVLALTACTRVEVVDVQAEPRAAVSGPAPALSPSAVPTPTSSSSATPPGPREPTDTDRARFVAAYDPPDAVARQHVATDLDNDGREELVFAYLVAGATAHIDVAWWTGTAYRVGFRADGGEGTQIDRLRVADINADGRIEIVTFQSGQGARSSASVWRVLDGPQIAGVVAAGGCDDGRNTYGVVGVRFADRDGDGAEEIEATCDDSPLPIADWSSDVYAWDGSRYSAIEQQPSSG